MGEAREQPEPAPVVEPLFRTIGRQEAEDLRARRQVQAVKDGDDGGTGQGRSPEPAAAHEGGCDRRGDELDQGGGRENRARQPVAAARPAQQRDPQQADRGRVDVAVAGEGPQGERVPRVDQDSRPRQPRHG